MHVILCMSYYMPYEDEEEDTCMSYEDEEEDTWSHCLVGSFQGNIKLVLRENKVFPYNSRGDSFKKLHSLAQV